MHVQIAGSSGRSEGLERVVGESVPGGEEVIVDVCQSWVIPRKIHD